MQLCFLLLSGMVSHMTLKRHLAKACPQWSKGLAKRILAKALDAGVVEQIKHSYKINRKELEKQKNKKTASKKKTEVR